MDAMVSSDVGPVATPAERLDAFQRLVTAVPPRMFPRLVAVALAGLVSYNLASRLLRGVASDDEMRTVLRGLPFNPTTEMDLDLWRIARGTRDDPQSRGPQPGGPDRGLPARRVAAAAPERARDVPGAVRAPRDRRDRPRPSALV
jgi:pyruvate,water dikinase